MTIFRLIPPLCLALALFSTGCATTPKRPEVNTWGDAQFTPTPKNTLALSAQLHPSVENAALSQLLTNEMQRAGFTFVPAAKADFLLAAVLNDVTTEQPYLRPNPAPAMLANPQSTQQIINGRGGYYAPTFTSQTTTVPVGTFVFHSQQISLYLYTNPQKSGDGLKMVWQGTIDAGKASTEDRERILIRTLLGYFGKVHGGEVDLVP